MPFLSVDGCELYYEVHGTGEPLIFAHGAGGSHLVWWQQVPYFRDRFRCVIFDHRGYGRSAAANDPTVGRHYVSDLAALIEHLGLDQVSLVAQSMGGWTCLGYTRRHPERVRRLVMSSTPGGLTSPEIEAALAKTWSGGRPAGSAPAAYGDRMARDRPDLAFLYDEIGALNEPRDREQIFALLREIDHCAREDVAGLSLPVLFLAGAEDASILPEAIRGAADLVPGAQYVEVPEAGHSIYFQYPERFNRLVDEFLSAVG